MTSRPLLALAAAALLLPASADAEGGHPDEGVWHGNYELAMPDGVEMTLTIDHLEGGTGGLADLYVAIDNPGFACGTLAPPLCDTLRREASGFYVTVTTEGVRIAPDRADIALHFGNGPVHILTIARGTDIIGRIADPHGTELWVGAATPAPHVCTQVMCMGLELRAPELVADPDWGRGAFGPGGALAGFDP